MIFHGYVSLPEGTPLKNMKVSWDDDYSQYDGKIIQMFQTTNRSCLICLFDLFLFRSYCCLHLQKIAFLAPTLFGVSAWWLTIGFQGSLLHWPPHLGIISEYTANICQLYQICWWMLMVFFAWRINGNQKGADSMEVRKRTIFFRSYFVDIPWNLGPPYMVGTSNQTVPEMARAIPWYLHGFAHGNPTSL